MGSVSVIGIQETFAIHATDGEVTADEIGEVDMETGEVKVQAEEEEEEVAAEEEEESNDSNGDGLKVRVHFNYRDNACVRTADDSHRAGCSPGNDGDTVTFQFNSGDIEEGEEVYACFQAYDDDCKSAINGPESEPLNIYQGNDNENNLPRCDGSFQDCVTQRGDLCVAGSTEDKCEIE